MGSSHLKLIWARGLEYSISKPHILKHSIPECPTVCPRFCTPAPVTRLPAQFPDGETEKGPCERGGDKEGTDSGQGGDREGTEKEGQRGAERSRERTRGVFGAKRAGSEVLDRHRSGADLGIDFSSSFRSKPRRQNLKHENIEDANLWPQVESVHTHTNLKHPKCIAASGARS